MTPWAPGTCVQACVYGRRGEAAFVVLTGGTRQTGFGSGDEVVMGFEGLGDGEDELSGRCRLAARLGGEVCSR